MEWHGPSFCRPRATNELTWRNAILRRQAEKWPLVAIQPFEELTSVRWDMHSHPVFRGGKWVSDCTHLCYSPRFWDRSFEDLHAVLKSRLGSPL